MLALQIFQFAFNTSIAFIFKCIDVQIKLDSLDIRPIHIILTCVSYFGKYLIL